MLMRVFNIADVLPAETKAVYQVKITKNANAKDDEIHLGYIPLKALIAPTYAAL